MRQNFEHEDFYIDTSKPIKKKPKAKKKNSFFSLPSLKSLFRTVAITATFGSMFIFADDLSHHFNEAANQNTPLIDRDNITVYDESSETIFNRHYYNLVSSDYIAEHHKIPYHTPLSARALKQGNMYMDLDRDDSFSRAIKSLEADMIEYAELLIKSDPDLSELMEKENWDAKDHLEWQYRITDSVLNLTARYPALGRYTSDEDAKDTRVIFNIADRCLNYLSEDIDNGTELYEIDCEQKSFIDNYLIHKVNEEFLGEGQKPRIYYTTSEVDPVDSPVQHAYNIVVDPSSDRILGVIEGTIDAYKFILVTNDVTLEEFADGEAILTSYGTVLGMNLTGEQVENLEAFHSQRMMDIFQNLRIS
jgi:hypothetical protein